MAYRALFLRSTLSHSFVWNLVVTRVSYGCCRPTDKVFSDSTRNQQVRTSVCRINFHGSSANLILFGS